MRRYTRKLWIFGFLAVVIFAGWTPEAVAKKGTVVKWGVQCFLEQKVGECKAGKPIRFEVNATSPELARKIANTAGARKKKWKRCFRVSRRVHQLATCDPKTGRITK
ncbi:MAG TPA: hypothetical protein DCS82_06345 [Rhodospirillaceae bacterium]|nr:hypothetical protein [Rhodospirillaceae bacterium]HAT35317.1 hypothetical protein [Rhodospirillaceae bacterium]|tara:strand:- start:65 stop:385 length:321 start_codon:yes stop_codon:yes gene_type:complete